MKIELLIHDLAPKWAEMDERELMHEDFTVPLVKGESVIVKGRKVSKPYYLNSRKCVEKTFKDAFDSDTGQLNGLTMTINYFKRDGVTVGYSFQKPIILGEKAGYLFMQDRRRRILADMESRAVKYNALAHMKNLLSFFHKNNEIENFIEYGSNDFELEVLRVKESDIPSEQGVKTVLNTSFDGIEKVWETIIYEIT